MTMNQEPDGPEDATPAGDASPADLTDQQLEEVTGGTLGGLLVTGGMDYSCNGQGGYPGN